MSFMDKFKGFANSNNDEDMYTDPYDRDEYDEDRDEYEDIYSDEYSNNNYEEENDEPVRSNVRASRSSSRVVDISSNSQIQVVVAKPIEFNEVTGISDHLNAKRTVVLNLEECMAHQDPNEPSVARRIIDFIGGVAYANDGKINRIAKSTYIIIPRNVDLLGDLADEDYSAADVFEDD